MTLRADAVLAGLLLAGATIVAACAGTPEREPAPALPGAHPALDALAQALVDDLRQRVDPSGMRLYVDTPREAREGEGALVSLGHGELEVVERELQRELVVALARRLNLIDVDLARRSAPPRATGATGADDRPVEERALALGATHALVGTFAPRRDELVLSLRLVDARDLVIVAAAGGALAVEELSDSGRLALAPPALVPPSVVDVAPRPVVAARDEPEPASPRAAEASPATGWETVPGRGRPRVAFRERAPETPAQPVTTAALQEVVHEPVEAGPAATRRGTGVEDLPLERVEEPAEVLLDDLKDLDGPALRRMRAAGRRLDGTPARALEGPPR